MTWTPSPDSSGAGSSSGGWGGGTSVMVDAQNFEMGDRGTLGTGKPRNLETSELLEIKVSDLAGIGHDERLALVDVVAHEDRGDLVRDDRLLEADLDERSQTPIH